MPKPNEDVGEDENLDLTEDQTVDEEEDEEDSSTEESESEEESSSDEEEEDETEVDAEIEKERKRGVPDPIKAKERFEKSKEKRTEGDEDEDEDKPLTRKDLESILASRLKGNDETRALEIAEEMAGSSKKAQLMVLKWQNRTFPASLTLREQMTEVYAITFAKKLIGERNEALRGLKGKKTVKKHSTTSHQDAQRNPSEPKLSAADAAMLKTSGFSWNVKERRYEKKLPNGLLIKDPKTNQVRLLRQK